MFVVSSSYVSNIIFQKLKVVTSVGPVTDNFVLVTNAQLSVLVVCNIHYKWLLPSTTVFLNYN